MKDRTLIEIVRAADPLERAAPDVDDPGRADALRESILDTPRPVASRRRRRPADLRVAVLVTALVAVVGLVPPASGIERLIRLLEGEPAPPAVRSSFESYTPQLGFRPDPDQAVLVAEDGDVSLYATTNREGTYCLTVSAPWRRPDTLPDGGTCVSSEHASAPFVAGVGGAAPAGEGGTILVVHGRTKHPAARSIRFASPNGDVMARPIGSSGFFVAAVHVDGSYCDIGPWAPAFSILGAGGAQLDRVQITLWRECALPGVAEYPVGPVKP